MFLRIFCWAIEKTELICCPNAHLQNLSQFAAPMDAYKKINFLPLLFEISF